MLYKSTCDWDMLLHVYNCRFNISCYNDLLFCLQPVPVTTLGHMTSSVNQSRGSVCVGPMSMAVSATSASEDTTASHIAWPAAAMAAQTSVKTAQGPALFAVATRVGTIARGKYV